METSRYEFSKDQNKVIKRLTLNLFFVGIFVLALGIFAGILDIYYWFCPEKENIVRIFVAVLAFVAIMMGLYTLASSRSFRRVFRSEGNDVDHLMIAIDRLATWFGILTFVIVVAVAILVLGALATLI
jgi:nitrate reductase gamma subunit